MGWGGFQILATILALITVSIVSSSYASNGLSGDDLVSALKTFQSSSQYLSIVNYGSYILLFIVMMAIVGRNIPRLFSNFKNKKCLYGILGGIALILISSLWSQISTALGATSDNENQKNIILIVKESPVLAVLCIGILGPFCEELTYRVGLFGLSKRANTYFAYIMASVFFAFIHMNFLKYNSSGALVWVNDINEWLSFPDYLISGFVFAWLYDKFGFGASFLAHITNNLVGVIEIIIVAFAA